MTSSGKRVVIFITGVGDTTTLVVLYSVHTEYSVFGRRSRWANERVGRRAVWRLLLAPFNMVVTATLEDPRPLNDV